MAEASRIVCYKSGVSDSGTDQWELVGRVPLAGASKDVQDMHGPKWAFTGCTVQQGRPGSVRAHPRQG